MKEWIIQYWVQFVFGIIGSGILGVLGYTVKKLYKLLKEEREKKQTELVEEIFEKTHAEDQLLQDQINNLGDTIDKVREGILSVQGSQFRRKCRSLLEPDHKITAREFEQLGSDHAAYNKLGGNHEGDRLFKAVIAKVDKEGLINDIDE